MIRDYGRELEYFSEREIVKTRDGTEVFIHNCRHCFAAGLWRQSGVVLGSSRRTFSAKADCKVQQSDGFARTSAKLIEVAKFADTVSTDLKPSGVTFQLFKAYIGRAYKLGCCPSMLSISTSLCLANTSKLSNFTSKSYSWTLQPFNLLKY